MLSLRGQEVTGESQTAWAVPLAASADALCGDQGQGRGERSRFNMECCFNFGLGGIEGITCIGWTN